MNDSVFFNKVTTSLTSNLFPNGYQESLNRGIGPNNVMPFRGAQSKTYPISNLINYQSSHNVNYELGKYQAPKVTFNSYSKPLYQFGQGISYPQTRYTHQDFLRYSGAYNNSRKLDEVLPHQNWNVYNYGDDRRNYNNHHYSVYPTSQNYSNHLSNKHIKVLSGLQYQIKNKSPVTAIGIIEENRVFRQNNFNHNQQLIQHTIQNHNSSKQTGHIDPLQNTKFHLIDTSTFNNNSKNMTSSKSHYPKYNLYSCIDQPFNTFKIKGCEAVTCPSNQICAKDDYQNKEWM